MAQFETGIASAITLFAPRRYGKTEFLLRDLVPEAEISGYRVVYASMWASRTHPLAALNNALKPNGLTERIRAVFQSPVKSLDVEAEITGIGKLGVSAGFENQQIQTNELLHLPELLDALIGRH